MKRIRRKFALCTVIFSSIIAIAQVPKTLNFQGVLTDPANGQAVVDAAYNFTFKIYDAATVGNLLWTELQALNTNDGLYNAVLGAVTPLNIAFDQPYWLEVTVEAETLSPRIELTAPAYTLDDDIEDLADGSLSGSKVGAGISASNITTGTISDARLEATVDRTAFNASGNITALGNVGIGTGTPDNSAILEVNSTNKGVLFPRMTKAQRDAMVKVEGLMIYQLDNTPGLRVYNGTGWDIMTPKFAIFRDQKSDATFGGLNVAGVQDRVLTEVEGETSFLTIPITFPGVPITSIEIAEPGTYLIEGSVPAYNVLRHQARIFQAGNIDPIILGTNEYNTGGASQTRSSFTGLINVATTSTIRIEHYTQSIQNPDGLGVANGLPTEEIYTIVKITKIAD